MSKNYKIFQNVDCQNLSEFFLFLANKAVENEVVKNSNDFLEALKEREKISSTGLENGIAIPHGISDRVMRHFIFVVNLKSPIEWKTFDNSKVKTAICFAVPKKDASQHLNVLKNVSIMLLEKSNQDLLHNGDLTAIQKLFDEIEKKSKIEIDNLANKLEKSVQELLLEKSEFNLYQKKHELIQKLKTSSNSKLEADLKIIEAEIKKSRIRILNFKKQLDLKQLNLKKSFIKKMDKSKSIISKTSLEKKKILKKYKSRAKIELKDYQKKVLDLKNSAILIREFKSNIYKTKLDIAQPLEIAKNNRILEQTDFKNQRLTLNELYINKMRTERNKIVNPKNQFYKHGNKIQAILMFFLAIIGIWAIVVGVLGVGTPGSFITSNYNSWSQYNVVGFDATLMSDWANKTVATNYLISIFSISFGIISFILLLPLKKYKIMNVYYEKKAIITTFIGIFTMIIAVFLVAFSASNISQYELLSQQAGALDKNFRDIKQLTDPLRDKDSFENSILNMERYANEIKIIFQRNDVLVSNDDSYKNWDEWINESNQTLALNNAKVSASENFDKFVIQAQTFEVFKVIYAIGLK